MIIHPDLFNEHVESAAIGHMTEQYGKIMTWLILSWLQEDQLEGENEYHGQRRTARVINHYELGAEVLSYTMRSFTKHWSRWRADLVVNSYDTPNFALHNYRHLIYRSAQAHVICKVLKPNAKHKKIGDPRTQ